MTDPIRYIVVDHTALLYIRAGLLGNVFIRIDEVLMMQAPPVSHELKKVSISPLSRQVLIY